MPVVRIADLAQVMVEELAPVFGHDPDKVEITTIGALPGEKMYEELLNEEEVRRTVELDRYYVVLPAFKAGFAHVSYDYPGSRGACGGQPYNSARDAPLTRDELRAFLHEGGLLDTDS
jgi:FlaA1/EpsC-like NDP-sugar epimerase